jgi:acyl carrier protein
MSRDEFTREFAEMLSIATDELNPDTDMTALAEWDSVAYLSAMVLIDEKLGIEIRPDVLSSVRTFNDILTAVGTALQDQDEV